MKTIQNRCFLAFLAGVLASSAWAQDSELTFNQLPNPELRGDGGSPAGNVTGEVPTQWRTFAVGASTATSAIVPVAADALFAGSPAVNAVALTVTNFGPPDSSDAGFDTSPNRFSLIAGQGYGATVYLRSNNVDMSAQTVTISLPVFDAGGVFTGNFANNVVQATGSWTAFEVPPITSNLVGASGELSFRLAEGASDNSVLIALPTVVGPSLENRVPNPEFSGSGGFPIENTTGDVPDFWRAFGLDSESGSVSLQTVPVAVNELYPGSPATTAIRVTATDLTGAGFDHEGTRMALSPAGRLVWGEVFLRADNADLSDQVVAFQMPIFNSDGTFSGASPGSVNVTATPEWRYFSGVHFAGAAGQTANLGFRMVDSGSENTVLIAMPTLKGLAERVFDNSFEGEAPVP